MRHTAVLHFIGNFGQTDLIVYKQFFDPLNFVIQKEPVSYTHLTLPTNREV